MATSVYNLVELSTGRIAGKVNIDLSLQPDFLDDNAITGFTYIEGTENDDSTAWYYVGTTLTARPVLTTSSSWNKTTFDADGVDQAIFGPSLPNPSLVTIGRAQGTEQTQVAAIIQQVTDGSIEVSAQIAGFYEIAIEAFPYQTYRTTIEAVAP